MADDIIQFSDLGDDAPAKPVEVNDSNFEEFIKKFPVAVIDCWAPWCGPCKMIAPTIHELAGDYQGKIAFAKLNTDESTGIAMKHRIMSIPTLLIFKDGEYADRLVGAMPKAAFEEQFSKLL